MPSTITNTSVVQNALNNPTSTASFGWKITHDPLFIEYGQEDMYVDLGAEHLLAAERGTEKIAVEIKSFVGTSTITELPDRLDIVRGRYAVL